MHFFLYVTCIRILPCYNKHGCVQYDTYVRHDIMRAPFPLWLWQCERALAEG